MPYSALVLLVLRVYADASAPLTAPAEVSAPATVTAPAAAPVLAAGEAPAPATGAVGEFGEIAENIDDLFTLSLSEQKNVSVDAASKYGQRLRHTPANVVVITRHDIRSHRYRSIPDALRSVPGFFVYNDTLYDFVNVRGLGLPGDFNTRILLLLNGHTLNVPAGSGGANLHDFNLDMQSVERIEVIKGPGGVLYGTGAFFAVINVITVSPQSGDDDYAAYSFGGPGAVHDASVSHGGERDGWWWYGSGRAYRDNGLSRYFAEYDPAVDGSDPDRAGYLGYGNKDRDQAAGAYVRAGYKQLSLSLYGTSRNKQQPDAPFYTVFNGVNYTEDQRYFAELAYENAWGALALNGRAYADWGNWNDYLDYPEGQYRDQIDDRKGGAEARALYTQGKHQLLTGVEASRHSSFMPSEYTPAFRAQRSEPDRIWYTSLNAYVQDDWSVGRYLSLVAGAQLNTHTLYRPAVLPRVGVLVFPTEQQTLKILYGRGIRQPTTFERFFKDFNAFIANPQLEPEFIDTFEAAYELYPTGKLRTSLGAFMNYYRDIITAVQVPFGADETRNQFLNRGRVRSRGIEAALEQSLPHNWVAQANGVYQEAYDGDTGLMVDASPHWLANMLASGPLPGLDDLLHAAADVHYIGSRRSRETGAAVNPYWLANAALSTKPLWDRVVLSAQGQNLFDAGYHEIVSSDHDPVTTVEGRPLTVFGRIDVAY